MRLMGVEILLLYFVMTLVLGPGTVIYGILIISDQRVRLSRGKILNGAKAVIAGIVAMIAGSAFTCLLWYMARFFPH